MKSKYEPWSDEWVAEMYPVFTAACELQRMLNMNALEPTKCWFSGEEINAQREKLRLTKEQR